MPIDTSTLNPANVLMWPPNGAPLVPFDTVEDGGLNTEGDQVITYEITLDFQRLGEWRAVASHLEPVQDDAGNRLIAGQALGSFTVVDGPEPSRFRGDLEGQTVQPGETRTIGAHLPATRLDEFRRVQIDWIRHNTNGPWTRFELTPGAGYTQVQAPTIPGDYSLIVVVYYDYVEGSDSWYEILRGTFTVAEGEPVAGGNTFSVATPVEVSEPVVPILDAGGDIIGVEYEITPVVPQLATLRAPAAPNEYASSPYQNESDEIHIESTSDGFKLFVANQEDGLFNPDHEVLLGQTGTVTWEVRHVFGDVEISWAYADYFEPASGPIKLSNGGGTLSYSFTNSDEQLPGILLIYFGGEASLEIKLTVEIS